MVLQGMQQATRLLGSLFPFRARGTTKSTRMTRAFSKLALPSSPQYWQRRSSRSRIFKPSFRLSGEATRDNVIRLNGMEYLQSGNLQEWAGACDFRFPCARP